MLTLARPTDLHPLIADRHSPRSFDPVHELDDASLAALLEAARWAPSAMNHQPWRLVVARRGTDAHAEVFHTLMPGNQRWAGDAAALVVAIAEHSRDGYPIETAQYDLGLAVAQMTTQAQAMGLHVHQMGAPTRPPPEGVACTACCRGCCLAAATGPRNDRLPRRGAWCCRSPATPQPLEIS
jgi:nitroreductase